MNHNFAPIRTLSMQEVNEVSGGSFWREVAKAAAVIGIFLTVVDQTKDTFCP